MSDIIIHTDGGARGNPGPAAIGVVIDAPGHPSTHLSACIGETTNNQAEYQAVLHAMTALEQLADVSSVSFLLDSELVVRQLKGEYKIKNADLALHATEIHRRIDALGYPVSFAHVRRAENAQADALVNAALDHQAKSH